MTNYPIHGDWRIRINGLEDSDPHMHVEFRDGHRVPVSIVSRRALAGGVVTTRR